MQQLKLDSSPQQPFGCWNFLGTANPTLNIYFCREAKYDLGETLKIILYAENSFIRNENDPSERQSLELR